MRSVCFFFLGVLLLVMQTTLFPMLPGWIGKPDLLFVLVIFLALRMKMFQGGVLTLLFGMLMDVFSGIFLGLCPTIYLILFFSIQWVSRQLIISEVSHQILLVVVGYLFMSSGIFIGSSMLDSQEVLNWSWPDIFLQMLILVILTIPLFYLFDRIEGFFDQSNIRWSFKGKRSQNRFVSPGPGWRS